MEKKQFYQASIVDELAYLMEGPLNTSITLGWVVTLEGEVHSKALRGALDACLNLYPKLKCTLTNNYPSLKRLFRYCWEYRDITSKDILQEFEDLNPDHSDKDLMSYYRDYHPSHCIDINREPPIKVLLIRQAQRSILIFFNHHAALDGISFLIFFQRFIEFYEDIFYQRKKESGDHPDFEAISRPHITFQWKHLLPQNIYTYIKYGPQVGQKRLALQHVEEGTVSMEELLTVAREISPSEFKALRTTAKNCGVSVNDYMLASMFHTVKKWNQQRNEKPGEICLDIPVNLRSPEDRTLGNVLCGFRISLASDTITDKENTLRLVKQKRAFMMENSIARKTVDFAWALKPLPVKLKKFLYRKNSQTTYPTLTISNIGIGEPNPSHQDKEGFHYMGPARICTVVFVAHAPPWPNFVAVTYNNRMTISLSVFRSQFSLETAGEFLQLFIQELSAEE